MALGLAGLAGLLCAGTLLAPFLIRRHVLQSFRVGSGAMEPTLRGPSRGGGGRGAPGDCFFADKLAYASAGPARGDIVVYHPPAAAGKVAGAVWVSRIVGLPGERIGLAPPSLVVDGRAVTNPAIFARMAARANGFEGYACATGGRLSGADTTLVLGPGEYAVMGDRSPASFDSRWWGAVPRTNIVSRVVRIYWPWSRAGVPE